MFENFNIDIINVFKRAEEERKKLKHSYVGTEHLLLSILCTNDEIRYKLNDYNVTYDNFKKEIIHIVGLGNYDKDTNLYTPLLKRIINNAGDNYSDITIKDLLISMIKEGEGIALRLLLSYDIDINKLYDELKKDSLIKNKNLLIYEIGKNLNENTKNNSLFVGRENEINKLIETLIRKKKCNPVLIGEAGVGKSAIVEALAEKINNKDVPKELIDKEIIMIEMGFLISGTKYRGEFEERLTKILDECKNNPNIILFIDEVHTVINAGGAEGAINAGDILKPYLAKGDIKIIGATTIDEYNKFFDKDNALKRRFNPIIIKEINDNDMYKLLTIVKKEYENYHKTFINNDILKLIIDINSKVFKNKKNPDKCIDYIDSLCAYSNLKYNNSKDIKLLYNELDILNNNKYECIKNNNYTKAVNLYNEERFIKNKLYNINNSVINITSNDVINVLINRLGININSNNIICNDIKYRINNILFPIVYYIRNTDRKTIENIIKNICSNYKYIDLYNDKEVVKDNVIIIDNYVNNNKYVKELINNNYLIFIIGNNNVCGFENKSNIDIDISKEFDINEILDKI